MILMKGRCLDVVFFKFAIQSVSAYSQPFGRLFFVPVAKFQRIPNQSGFTLHHGADGSGAARSGWLGQNRWEVGDFDPFASGQYRSVLDTVFQLTDIPGPGVVEYQPHGFGAELFDVLFLFIGEPFQKIPGL